MIVIRQLLYVLLNFSVFYITDKINMNESIDLMHTRDSKRMNTAIT